MVPVRRVVAPLCLAVAVLDGVAAFQTPSVLPLAGPARASISSVRKSSLGLRMGLFDGLAKAVNDGLSVPGQTAPGAQDPSQFTGWIERAGMQAFSFDGVQPGQAPAAAPQQSGGLFGMFGGGGAAPAAAAQVPPDKENQDGVVLVPNLYDGCPLLVPVGLPNASP